MHFGLLTIHFKLYSCNTLKDKRSLLRPLENRLSEEFNVSIAESSFQDSHRDAELTLGLVNNNAAYIQAEFSRITVWMENHFPDLLMYDQKLEIM